MNHNLDEKQWTQLFEKMNKYTFKQKSEQKYKLYHIDNYLYEFDVKTAQYRCYSDEISKVDQMKFIGDLKSALTYTLNRTEYPKALFNPVNKYYNIYEVNRWIFSDDDFQFVFEKTDKSYELKLILFKSEKLDQSLKLLGIQLSKNIRLSLRK